MRRLGDARVAHRVMVSKGRWLRASRRTQVVGLWLIRPTSGHRSPAHTSLSGLVGGVVKQGTNVVYEERVKKLGDSLFVREIQRAVEGYPVSR